MAPSDPSQRSINQLLTKAEIRALTEKSDRQAWLSVGCTWGIIAFAFWIAARWPGPVSVAVALVLLGGRQLALAILTHECAHRAFFRSNRTNRFVGRWLCGAPMWVDVDRYREHHLRHHAHAGSAVDPDLTLSCDFPVSRRSMVRKVARDLVGITGLRRIVGLVLMDYGYFDYTASDKVTRSSEDTDSGLVRLMRFAGPTFLTNAALGLLLLSLGHGWLYLLWIGAYLTTFSLFLRIRSIAEHACTDADPSPLRHTRTTLAGPLARLTVAPHHVNYHAEHHLLPTVPHYRLRRFHRLLQAKNAFETGHLAANYREVMRIAVT